MKKSDLFESSPETLRFRAALAGLSPLQREILSAGLSGDDECSDGEIADRHGTSAAAIRVERILARRRLSEILLSKES
jgi:DNA-directed RNA polymerase specialized sigma24 family protein